MTSQTTTALAPGDQLTTRAGCATVVLTAGVNSFNVTCWQGINRPDGWSWSYATEAEARAEARRATILFRAHQSDVGIERHRTQLVWERDHRNTSPKRAAQIDTELDGLQDLATRAQTPSFVATVTRRLAA